MQGTDLTDLTFDGVTKTLTIVGKSATVSPGARSDITVNSGILYVRDLTVTNTGASPATCIVANGGQINLDRVVVKGCTGGGILLNNAAFSISNSIIAQNSPAASSTFGIWSGVLIGEVPTSGPAVMANDTIAENATSGVSCSDTSNNATRPRLSGLLFWHNGTSPNFFDLVGSCSQTACCVDSQMARIDPMFVNSAAGNYHLQSMSMCLATVPASLSPPPYDIDGDPRPAGAASDCGADEYVAPLPGG